MDAWDEIVFEKIEKIEVKNKSWTWKSVESSP
jgi:hypothetical protein